MGVLFQPDSAFFYINCQNKLLKIYFEDINIKYIF